MAFGVEVPGVHIFGLDREDHVVCEIKAWPDTEGEGLLVEVRRDTDVSLLSIVEVVQGVGRSLWRLAHNPEHLEILFQQERWVEEKGYTEQ